MSSSFRELTIALNPNSGKLAEVTSVGMPAPHEYIFNLSPEPASTFRAHFVALVAKESLGQAWVNVNGSHLTLTSPPGLTQEVVQKVLSLVKQAYEADFAEHQPGAWKRHTDEQDRKARIAAVQAKMLPPF